MYIEVTQGMFIDAFAKAGRKDSFSYDGLCGLFDYLTEVESDSGSTIELDVIAICCSYSEYASKEEAVTDLGLEEGDELDNYVVIELDNGGVIIGD